jgi:hypothetical protein
VADAWHSKHIARPVGWWDQAAVLHLMKQPDIKRQHCLVYQRALNAYPNMTRCHDGGGVFKVREEGWLAPGSARRHSTRNTLPVPAILHASHQC